MNALSHNSITSGGVLKPEKLSQKIIQDYANYHNRSIKCVDM